MAQTTLQSTIGPAEDNIPFTIDVSSRLGVGQTLGAVTATATVLALDAPALTPVPAPPGFVVSCTAAGPVVTVVVGNKTQLPGALYSVVVDLGIGGADQTVELLLTCIPY